MMLLVLPPSFTSWRTSHQNSTTSNSSSGQDSTSSLASGTAPHRQTLAILKSPELNPSLTEHSNLTFKLFTTVADFTQQLSSLHEQHAEELQLLVEGFRKRNAELRRERSSYQSTLFHAWEVMLQEVEVDSQVHNDISRSLSRHVGMTLLEKTFHRKIQSRKIFLHRDSLETILSKAEEMLSKCHQDYSEAYRKLVTNPNHNSLAEYYDLHNAYVQQLHATNGMLEVYHTKTLPGILEELEEIYIDLSDTMACSLRSSAEILCTKAREQASHYDNIVSASRNINTRSDLQNFVQTLSLDKSAMAQVNHPFVSSHSDSSTDPKDPTYCLQDELILDRELAASTKPSSLRQELATLETQIRQLQESLDSMDRLQQRSLENNLYNKANELQEDISMKKFDLQVAYIHQGAVKSQLDLFKDKDPGTFENGGSHQERKSSTSSIKSKWMKALRSLKTSPEKTDSGDKKKSDSSMHVFQEYTYKKISACDHCREILRGHARQGLRCKMCKMNVHSHCQDKVSPKCQSKSKLLRRQKSASEIDPKVLIAAEILTEEEKPVDPVYQLLKQAGDLGRPDQSFTRPHSNASSSSSSSHMLSVSSQHPHSSCSAPHSPQRKKLSLRMKSFSLDSPESSEHVHRIRHAPHSQSPQSPSHRRQLLASKTIKMSSVDLPDENDKSLSSASTSPCPSPKPHRLLPTNLYVGLYNFRSRHPDELDLKAGWTVTVTDTSDPDWWQGKCLGKVGYFPSKYVTRLHPGERALQVVHNVQLTNGEGEIKLVREQIVIQLSDENDGKVTIRTPDKNAICPLKYLQEI